MVDFNQFRESRISDDDQEESQILNGFNSLDYFRKLIESGESINKLSRVAEPAAQVLDMIAQPAGKKRVDALADKYPLNDFADYGQWRVTRSGNANYSDYIKARDALAGLHKAQDNIEWFGNVKKTSAVHFSSISDVLLISVDLHRVVRNLTSAEESRTLISAKMEESDLSLCLMWSGKLHDAAPPPTLSEAVGAYEAARLLSARAAERAAAAYYRSIGEKVEDVSVAQLQDLSARWQDFDLLAGERPIDVKNARRSFSSPDTYVEHCVPRFKMERKYGNEVAIAGVLSDYGAEDQIWSGALKSLILGEVYVSHIRKLYSWMRQRFGALIELNGLWKQGYVPGWMFEYPDAHYETRKNVVAELPKLLHRVKRTCLVDKAIPGWLLALSASLGTVELLNDTKIRKKCIQDLYLLERAVGFSRPSLYIYAMTAMLESMLVDSSSNETADVLKELFFVDGDITHPLLLLDTQKYVANIIGLIDDIGQEIARRNIQITGFLMPHPSILQGTRRGLPPLTLIAYCGGWLEAPVHVKCGANPLFLGRNEPCPSCSRLACDKCGYCADGCAMGVQRQTSCARAARKHY